MLARSRPFRFALLIQDNLPYSACHASAQTSGCGRHLFYASKPSLPHSRHFPHLRHFAHAPAPRLKHREVDEWRSGGASFTRSKRRERDAFWQSLANRWVRRLRGRGGPQERETRDRSASRAARCKRDKRMSGKAENSDGWQKTAGPCGPYGVRASRSANPIASRRAHPANAPVQASRISTH